MPATDLPRAAPAHAALTAAFFLVLAVLPWLNPVSGGAMTAAIPLLVGWVCIALLFAGLPVQRGQPEVLYGFIFLFLAALIGVVLDKNWQLLAVSLLMVGASAAVGVRLVQAAGVSLVCGCKRTGTGWIAWSWLVAGLLNAGIGLLQYFQATAWLGPLVNYAPVGQVYGNLRQRNQFATLMNMALWALWYLWDSGYLQALAGKLTANPDPARAKTGAQMLAWLLMAPLSVCMALTLSRTGVMQLLLLLGMLAGWNWRRTGGGLGHRELLGWLAGLVVFYAGAAYVLPYLHGGTDIWLRLEGRDSRTCISRTVLWGNVLRLIAEKPLTGWGWGELDFAHYNAHYPGMRFCEMLDNAHNLPLHLAVELGVPVAVVACSLALWWVLRNRVWRESVPARQLMWGVLAALAVHSLLEYPLWYAPFQLACGLACGVLWATRPQGHAASPGSAPRTLPVQRALAALLLAGLAYAVFDYVRVTQLYMVEEDRIWPFKGHAQEQAQRSVLYQNAVHFANISMQEVSLETAEQQLAEAQNLMHYSPEARVAERIIECLRVLGRMDEARLAEAQFASVYPKEHAHWVAQSAKEAQPSKD